MTAARTVAVAGVGLTQFGRHEQDTIGSLASRAVDAALQDAGVAPTDVDVAIFANAAEGMLSGQEMIRGQVALKGTGLEGRPIFNTENACASGSSAAHLASLYIASGQASVAVAVGAERLCHPDRARSFAAIESGIDQSLVSPVAGTVGRGSPMMDAYARSARAYARKYGEVEAALSAIAAKNRKHAADNPNAQFRDPITPEDVVASREIAPPLRLLMCSPLTDGAAAVVFRKAEDVPNLPRRPRATVAASVVGSHRSGESVVTRTARSAYDRAGLTPDHIDVFQLHDACAFAELVQYEQVGLVPEGGAIEAATSDATGRLGERPTNTDGGLMSRGHPLGATGIAQLVELSLQLQSRAGARQVDGGEHALAVNAGGWMGDDYATATVTILTTRG